MEAESLEFRPLIRPYRPTDHNLIMDSWIGSFIPVSSKKRAYEREHLIHYRSLQRLLIHSLLSLPYTRIAIAASPEFDDAILGWACATGDILHYTHVKLEFRGLGIMRDLIRALGLNLETLSYSHKTKKFEEIMRRFPGSRYEPKAALAR